MITIIIYLTVMSKKNAKDHLEAQATFKIKYSTLNYKLIFMHSKL